MFRHAPSLATARNSLNALRRTLSTSHASANPIEASQSTSTLAGTSIPAKRERNESERQDRDKASSSSPRRPVGQYRQQTHPPQLRGPTLSYRIQALARGDFIDDAVLLLKNAPLDAQNVVNWNTLIAEVMKARKYKLAYSVYVDMKRRGFVPDFITYATLLKGYAQIDGADWPHYTLQLENVHKAFDSFLACAKTIKDQKQIRPEYTTAPITHYFVILGRAGLQQRLFELYNIMNIENPTALSPFVYSAIFTALSYRKILPPGMEGDVAHQNASDAKLIWRQMLKNFDTHGYKIDSHIVRSLLFILISGRPGDQLFAFEIIREYVGLVPPGDPPVKPKVPLNAFLLESVLQLCMTCRKHSLCIHYLLQVLEKEPHVVDHRHCDTALRALAGRASLGSLTEPSQALGIVVLMLREAVLNKTKARQIWPTLHTYRAAFATCWRGGDWPTAVRLFELMTRLDADNFLDNKEAGVARPGRTLWPDAPVMSFLVRTALVSREPANMRQCLRMVERIGVLWELRADAKPGDKFDIRSKERIFESNHFRVQYALSTIELVSSVLEHNKKAVAGAAGERDSYVVSEEEEERWKTLQKEVQARLDENPPWAANTLVPWLEQNVLGSVRGVAAMDSHVDYQMTNRHIKSA